MPNTWRYPLEEAAALLEKPACPFCSEPCERQVDGDQVTLTCKRCRLCTRLRLKTTAST